MKTLEKLLLVKQMITQLVVSQIILSLKNYEIIAIDLSKQQALNADPKAVPQINFNANLGRPGNTTTFFIIEEAEETVLDFS